jgi:ubiquinol-cytochrome c reductase cytochrome b subunit
VVLWLWGGFNVGGPTLSFFFTLHYLLPFAVLAFVLVHLIFLHETGRTRPLTSNDNNLRVRFNPFFTSKDFLNFSALCLFFMLVFFSPWKLGDPENWIPANPLVSPVHIQPEWYFLFAYAILRAIPRKLGGVIALVLSIFVFYFLPFYKNLSSIPNMFFYFSFSLLLLSFLLLTWLGSCPVEEPYIFLRQFFRVVYFLSIGLFFIF